MSYLSSRNDLSNKSIALLYSDAFFAGDFEKFKNIGDWLFFAKSMYPEHLKDGSEEYYNTLARSAYYKCFKLLNKQWLLYEELADQFPIFTEEIKKSIRAPKQRFFLFNDSFF